MEMIFPLNVLAEWGFDTTLFWSLLIGVGFGFMLERGGFGSSKVLAAIFYGKDWRVLKVMFSAIVTTMLGLYLLIGLGTIQMDAIAFRPTYIYPQAIGGLLLGFGFVMAGYCPGTSVVGIVSGRLDALFVVFGIMFGCLGFENHFARIQEFWNSGSMGVVTLHEWLGVNPGIIVMGVVFMAVGAFSAVGYFEKKASGVPFPKAHKMSAGAAVIAGMIVATISFAGPGNASVLATAGDDESVAVIQPMQLLEWAAAERQDCLCIDLRPEGALPEMPNALKFTADELLNLRTRPSFAETRTLIVIDASGSDEAIHVAADLRAGGASTAILAGGAEAWQSQVLDPGVTDALAKAWQLRLQGKSALGEGAAPPPAPKKKKVKRKKRKEGGCS